MRPLEFARPRTVSEKAEATAALRWLEQQPVLEGLSEANVTARLRYIVAVARQYQRHGLSLLEVVEIGYRAGLIAEDLWALRVRAGMAGAAEATITGSN